MSIDYDSDCMRSFMSSYHINRENFCAGPFASGCGELCPADQDTADLIDAGLNYLTQDQCDIVEEDFDYDLSDSDEEKTFCISYAECQDQCEDFDYEEAFEFAQELDWGVPCSEWESPCDDVNNDFICTTHYDPVTEDKIGDFCALPQMCNTVRTIDFV